MHTLSCFFRKQINFRVQTFCEISTFRLLAACFLSTLPSNLLKCSLRQRNSPPPLPLETCASGLVLSLSSLDRTFPSKKPGYGPSTYYNKIFKLVWTVLSFNLTLNKDFFVHHHGNIYISNRVIKHLVISLEFLCLGLFILCCFFAPFLDCLGICVEVTGDRKSRDR